MLRALLAVAGLSVFAFTSPAGAFRAGTQRADWVVSDVAKDARSVVLAYAGGGCEYEVKATVGETRARVHIRLDQRIAIPEGNHQGCTADLRVYRIRVRLTRSVAGRALVGHGKSSSDIGQRFACGHRDCRFIVPRVQALSPRDAARTLGQQNFRFQVAGHPRRGHRPRVVAQSPHGEATVKDPGQTTVRLRVGG